MLSGNHNNREPINLTLLESTPLFGALVGAVVVLLGRIGHLFRTRRRLRDMAAAVRRFERMRRRLVEMKTGRQTAILAGAIATLYGVLYFSFLPLYSQLTVRYLLPAVPALAVVLVCLSSIRTAMIRETRLLLASYAAVVAVGVGFVALVLPAFHPAIGEAMQLHALVNLGGVVLLAGAVIVARTRGSRAVAVGLGVAAGLTTALVVGMQLAYFEYGVYALPVAKAVADAVVVVP